MNLAAVCIFVLMGIAIGYFIGVSTKKSPTSEKDEVRINHSRHLLEEIRQKLVYQSIGDIVSRRLMGRLREWYPNEKVEYIVKTPVGSPVEILVKVGDRTAEIESTEVLEQIAFGKNEKETLEKLLK